MSALKRDRETLERQLATLQNLLEEYKRIAVQLARAWRVPHAGCEYVVQGAIERLDELLEKEEI